MNLAAFILSMASLLCMVISSLVKGNNMKTILVLVCVANLFVAVSYFIQTPMAVNGGISCTVGAVMSFINYFYGKKNRELPKWLLILYALVPTVLNAVVVKEAADLLTIVAGLSFVMCVVQKSGKMYRFWTIINMLLWCTYDFFKMAQGPLTQHILLLVFTVAGMIIHDRNKKSKA